MARTRRMDWSGWSRQASAMAYRGEWEPFLRRLADDFEARGRDYQAIHVLELVVASDVPAAAEAAKRIGRIRRKGNFL